MVGSSRIGSSLSSTWRSVRCDPRSRSGPDERPSVGADGHELAALLVPARDEAGVHARGSAQLSREHAGQVALVGGAATGLADVEQRRQLGHVAVALGQQAGVLDGHRSLVGEHAEQSQLIVGEAREAQSREHDHADDPALGAQRRQQHRLLGQVRRAGDLDRARDRVRHRGR